MARANLLQGTFSQPGPWLGWRTGTGNIKRQGNQDAALFSFLYLFPRVSRGNENFGDRVVCFFVLRSRPDPDHMRRPWHAAVRDTEQFPGLPGNEVG